MEKKAIYPGSFDPFTNGHLDVVKKAAALFDQVVIAIGINTAKSRQYDTEIMIRAIEKTLEDSGIQGCTVCTYSCLVAEFARMHGIRYMIRGLRNTTDYNYEENIAEVNKLINPELEYVYFRANNVGISSSMVRELMSFGRDVSPYVPAPVLEALKQ